MGVALWSSSSQHLPKPRDSLTMAATTDRRASGPRDRRNLREARRLQLLRLLWLLLQLLEKKRECQLSSHWRRPNNPFQDENKTAATGNILAKKPTNTLDLN